MCYYPITQDMRDAGLFGPYLDYVGPYPTAAIRDAEQAKAQQHASRILKARATRRSPMPDTKLFYYYSSIAELLKGCTISDAIATISSLNIIAGELDC